MSKTEVKQATKNSVSKKHGFMWNISHYKSAYMLILPGLFLVIALSYVPYGGLVMAFKDYNILKGIWGSPWVGFDNFKKVFSQPDMLHAIKNSFVYGSTKLFLGFPFPVVLALLFNEIRNARFKKVVQTISYLPHFLSWITVVGLFGSIFSYEGIYNTIMKSIIGESYEATNILYNPDNFLGIIFTTHIWKDIGWSSIIFLAAIVGIDPTLYEAATVDGCGKFKQIIHITLPGISGTVLIVFVMSLAGLFSVSFEQVYGFQNVYIQEETDTINTIIYRLGIQNGKYSLATAFGLAQGFISLTLLLMSNFMSRKLFKASIF